MREYLDIMEASEYAMHKDEEDKMKALNSKK